MKAYMAQWYPSEKETLMQTLEGLLHDESASLKKTPHPVIGLISPHAGYTYSGATAAKAFRELRGGNYKRIYIIGPSHRQTLFNTIVAPNCHFYETPIGQSPIDRQSIALLSDTPDIKLEIQDAPFLTEHSVDNQIPFIQYLFPQTPIVPLIVGHFEIAALKKAANAIKRFLDNETLIVISSDFTHYGQYFDYTPFSGNIEAHLRHQNLESAQYITDIAPEKLWAHYGETHDTICGIIPIMLLLEMMSGIKDIHAQLADYTSSGHITGDFSHSVSYMSFFFQGSWR